jgi:hypothetical protein
MRGLPLSERKRDLSRLCRKSKVPFLKPGRVFRAALGVHADAGAVLDDLEAKAVPFGFMQPIVALWWSDGCGRRQGLDERDNGHVPYVGLQRSDVTPCA